jgi:hypothetical protein
VDIADYIGTREDEVFVAAFQRRTAKILGGQITLLQHGSHRPVEDEYTGGKGIFESLATDLPLSV